MAAEGADRRGNSDRENREQRSEEEAPQPSVDLRGRLASSLRAGLWRGDRLPQRAALVPKARFRPGRPLPVDKTGCPRLRPLGCGGNLPRQQQRCPSGGWVHTGTGRPV